jgi:hypothetical protein
MQNPQQNGGRAQEYMKGIRVSTRREAALAAWLVAQQFQVTLELLARLKLAARQEVVAA